MGILGSWSVRPSTKVMKNGSLDLSAFLHEVRGPKMQETDRALFFRKRVGAEILGVLCPKTDFFGHCSRTALTIFFIFSQKIALLKPVPTI